MYRNKYVFGFLVLTLVGLGGCSSGPSDKESKKGPTAPDKIQGKAQEVSFETTSGDAAMNAGGPSLYLWVGLRRYRLFFRTAAHVEPGKEYIAEGVYAQKAIDELGDPDQGKNGYPLEASSHRVVKTAWPGLAFDVTDLHAATLYARVKRYPARPVFLVTRITPVTKEGDAKEPKKTATAGDDIPEVSVAADKQRALLIEGPVVQTAPLWAPAGGKAVCKLLIDTEGKIADLETGKQLCENVPWDKFCYKPTLQRGRPVKVRTEVEVTFEARK